MIHRTYAPCTAQLYTELGFGTTDATFTDFWQSAHTLLHSQPYLQSCHRSARAALVPAAPISACSTLCQGSFLYKLCLGAAVSVHPWGLTWLSSKISMRLVLIHTWVWFTVDLLRLFLIEVQKSNRILVLRHTQSSQTDRRNWLLGLPPAVIWGPRLKGNLHVSFVSLPGLVSSQRETQCSPWAESFLYF